MFSDQFKGILTRYLCTYQVVGPVVHPAGVEDPEVKRVAQHAEDKLYRKNVAKEEVIEISGRES